jgi:hypothetical protein
MAFFRDISPTRAGRDLIAFLREDRPQKPLLLSLSCIPAVMIVYFIHLDSLDKSRPPPPTVTYFESWPLSRSLEETKKAVAEREVEKAAYREQVRQNYIRLGLAAGMDVKAIEREAAAKRAADKAAEDAKKSGDAK